MGNENALTTEIGSKSIGGEKIRIPHCVARSCEGSGGPFTCYCCVIAPINAACYDSSKECWKNCP